MELIIDELIYFVMGLLTGAIIFWIISALFGRKKVNKQQYALLEEKLKEVEKEKEDALKEQTVTAESLRLETERANERENKLIEVATQNDYLKQKLEDQKIEFTQLDKKFSSQFENLANRILEEKSQQFSNQSEQNLSHLLQPLNDKIKSFEEQIQKTHLEDTKQRASLLQQFKQMSELNKRMSEDAQNLTKALKGDNKTQGNWGELVLANILEKSGLVKGREYNAQKSFTTANNKRLQPDVIINLPDNRHIIIDSKVSLTAYERSIAEDDPEKAKTYLQRHIESVKTHIRQLSGKNYPQLYQLQSLDFVLLFVPVEPAFALAIQHDPDLFNNAFKQNIIIVSPTTLLATLRTVANIWRQEKQTKNALEIARQSGALYDKFVNFVKDLEQIGKYINMTERSYEKAMNKLYLGEGNLIRRAEKIRQLGARNSKELPRDFRGERLTE